MKPIKEILEFTEFQYQDLLFEIYFDWCKIYGNDDDVMIQKLLINKSIRKWFTIELRKHIAVFREYIKPYDNLENLKAPDKRKLFINTVDKVFDFYPSAILDQLVVTTAEKRKDKNFLNN